MTIGYIDPYLNEPSLHCYKDFLGHFGPEVRYHAPSVDGFASLYEHSKTTSSYFVAGSASNVTEPLSWHGPLAAFLISELELGKPVLAVCFGHQLLCHAFGSVVDYHSPERTKLKGVRAIKIKQDFWNFKEDETFHLPITHMQVVKSLGKDLMCVGEGLANDLVIHRQLPLLMTQSHPEASRHFCDWDIQTLTLDEVLLGRRDGKRFIERFLRQFDLLGEF